MKKLVSMILTGVLVLSLTACGNTNTASDAAESTTVGVEESAVTEESSETETTGETTAEETTAEEETESTESAATKTIVDHDGVEMEIPTEINRIVVNAWQLPAPLAVYLGGAEKIVGIAPASMVAAENSVLSDIYTEILNASTSFNQGGEINIEELLKLDPDIVIGVSGEQAQSIRDAGIPAVSFSVSQWDYDLIETNDEWIKLFDQIFGGSELSNNVAEYSKQVHAAIQEKVSTLAEEDKKKVMFLFTYSDSTMTTSGKSFFGQSWCDLIGAVNVGEEIETVGSASINMEQVYEWNPDVIIITNFTSAQPEDLYNNTIGSDDWSTVNAVKNGQVYKMPLGWYRSYTPGVDTPITLQWLAQTVYPELFGDVDIEQVAKDYFKDYYEIELTDEQMENMFNPSSEASAY
ncbi:MAG: ABC transporter substrate-binding protein [Lachnospiraceae bacterium]|nr:ABC transporter substrate-binding protein [Lachnospiraceae bacterium]